MSGVHSFRGIRFASRDLKEIITEPYDKIPKDLQRSYYERSEHNFIRLNLPMGEDPYSSSKATLDRWLGSGVLKEDATPSFYEYIEEFVLFGENRTRKGMFAIVKLEDYESHNIFRHEMTFTGPKADRMEMLRATSTDLEPVFFLYDDPDMQVKNLIDSAKKENCSDFMDENGTRHLVNRFESSKITEIFQRKSLVIADGHHRYESALAYAKEKGFAENTGYVMAVLVNRQDPGLEVLSSHRVVSSGTIQPDRLLRRLSEYFEIKEKNKKEVKDPLGDEIVYYYKDHCYSLTPKESLVSSMTILEKLNVSMLNKLVMAEIQGTTDGGKVEFTRWASDALDRVDNGSAQYAFLLKPTNAATVWEVAIGGGVMPQKSTDFYPKLVSGLLMFRLS